MQMRVTYGDRDVFVGVITAAVVVFLVSGLVGYLAAEPGHRWELASIFGTALGMTLLAGATGFLAYSTRSDVRATVRLGPTSRNQRSTHRCSRS
jgi:putative Ca2+/H+ antiporter (TMEM165/GDT1 family)